MSPRDVHISWRGDGKYFSSIIKMGDRWDGQGVLLHRPMGLLSMLWLNPVPLGLRSSKLQTWERSSWELHAVAQFTEGLQPVMAWQPNGRHQYVSAAVQGQQHIMLFERNGLQHGGFDLGTTGGLFM